MTSDRLIGGEMEIFPRDLSVIGGTGAWPTFKKNYALRCDTGRSALKLALSDWRRRSLERPGSVWLPSYVCPSVYEAVEQLALDVKVYDDRPGYQSWVSQPAPESRDALVMVHYFGLLNRPALKWLAELPTRSWTLIEDCVQAPYTTGAGTFGDYAITSLRKWWAAPDGGLVAANRPLDVQAPIEPCEAWVSQRLTAKLLRGQRCAESDYLRMTEESEAQLTNSKPREVSWVSSKVLAAVDPASANALRQANWRTLSKCFSDHPAMQMLFCGLGENEVPLAFPILVAAEKRDQLRLFLRDRHVYCPVHWPLPLSRPSEDLALSRQILSIPLDHRYSREHMEYIAACIEDFFSKEPS
jgi:dTDP-4-amino-4,6-dideoxygalactose transaminase